MLEFVPFLYISLHLRLHYLHYCSHFDFVHIDKNFLFLFQLHFYLLVLANNQENLFEIVNTNQMFFRYYEYTDVYVVGIAKNYDGAVEILRRIMTEGYGADQAFDPRSVFTRNRFFPN